MRGKQLFGLLMLAGLAPSAWAQNLGYTFLDFQMLNTSLDAVGEQTTVPGQTVTVHARSGDGVAVAGAVALGERFYFTGNFTTAVIDVDGLVQSPFAQADVTGRFDLVQSSLGIGMRHGLARNLDVIAELVYDTADYDFGSFAGERFDMRHRGPGGRIGFRWNAAPPVEFHAAARFSAVATPSLTNLDVERDVVANVGFRWYFFQDLGAGLAYESGNTRTVTLSLRFGFGNLPW